MDYCDVFISCLDSFWRHPFTSEDPLVSKLCNAIFFQICSDEETTHLHGCKEAENFWKFSRICGVFSSFGKNLERVFFFTEIFCPFSTPTKSTFLMAWGWVNFKQILIFGWTIPLIIVIYIYIYNYFEIISSTVHTGDHDLWLYFILSSGSFPALWVGSCCTSYLMTTGRRFQHGSMGQDYQAFSSYPQFSILSPGKSLISGKSMT